MAMNLLTLPRELRLKIYETAISSRPAVISIDEGATSIEPPRSSTAKALASIDRQLAREMMPMYWSSNIFETYLLSGMGHYIPTDRDFCRWLGNVVKHANAPFIRRLRFKGALMTQLDRAPTCLMTVDVDVKRRIVTIWDKQRCRCTCEHAVELTRRIRKKLDELPVVNGRLRPTLPDLWDISECWYAYQSMRGRPPRSWDEFDRHYSHHGP